MHNLIRVSTIFVCLIAALPVHAQDRKFYAGAETGDYFGLFCPHVLKTITANPFFFTEFTGCEVSRGSAANIEQVLANPKAIGLSQADVALDALAQNPDKLAVSTADMGHECLFFVTNDASVNDLNSLPSRLPVALAGEGSGSDRTFRFLQSLNPSLESLRNIQRFGSSAEAVDAVIAGQAVMAFFVQFPNMQNQIFQKLLNAENISFVPVISRPILRREVNGVRVYEPMEIKLQGGIRSRLRNWFSSQGTPSIETTCMRLVTVTGAPSVFPEDSEANKDQVELLKALNSVTRPTSGGWGDIWNNMQRWSNEKLEQVQGALGG